MKSVEIVFQDMPTARGRAGQSFFFDPAWVAPCHFHPSPEFNLVLEGEGTYVVAGETLRVRSGTLLWFAPGVAHGIVNVSLDFRMRAMHFDRAFAEIVANRGPRPVGWETSAKSIDPARLVSAKDVLAIDERCAALARVEWPCYAGSPELTARILSTVKAAFALGSRASGSACHPAVARATHLLERDPGLRRRALAQNVGLSEAELSRKFERGVGASLPLYRNRLRVARVAELWSRGERNLTRVAFQAGFGSYSQFHRVFVELTSCPPQEYFFKGQSAQWLSLCHPLPHCA